MRSTLTRVLLIVTLFLSALPEANAQFERWPGFVKNIEIGYGYSKTWADYTRKDHVIRGDGKEYDTTITDNVSSQAGISMQFGTSIPLKRLGWLSSLNLGVAGVYNMYTWDYPTANSAILTDTGIYYDYSKNVLFTGATMNAGLALSADFKFGVDAMMDKAYRWGWTGGIGVIPSANMTADFDNAQMTFGVQPFLKTELALRAGIVWKLRVMYAAGKLDYLNVNSKNGFLGLSNAERTTELIGKGNFTVALLAMPFSWTYKRSAWYNTH